MGQPHREESGCDIERCALCGGQRITCDCVYLVNGLNPVSPEEMTDIPTSAMWAKYDEEVARVGGPLVWTGEHPGEAECLGFGWYCVHDQERGRVPARSDTIGAVLDLNRYARACAGQEPGFRWDVAARRLVRIQ